MGDIQLVPGKDMMYQLTDEEGGRELTERVGNRKVSARISSAQVGERGGEFGSQRLVDLFIFRPLWLGGSFDKDDVVFNNAREPGTCDTVQPGDQVD